MNLVRPIYAHESRKEEDMVHLHDVTSMVMS